MARVAWGALWAVSCVAVACTDSPRVSPPVVLGEGEGDVGEGEGEGEPDCTAVTGTGSVTFTHDEGATLLPSPPLTGTIYTYALVAVDALHIVAESGGRFLKSSDGGCAWRDIGAAPTTAMHMSVGGNDVYAWADNGSALVRIDGTDTGNDAITVLAAPTGSVHGLAGDDSGTVVIGVDAALYTSTDRGVTFSAASTPALPDDPSSLLVYRTAFAPKNTAHAIVATAGSTHVTTDGGATWTSSAGLSSGRSNVFNVVVSPADENVVWAEGIDIVENLQNPPNEGRHIWRSTDGGVTFEAVVEQTAAIILRNGSVMAAHPENVNILYFIFGTYFGGFGTNLYRHDMTTAATTFTHNDNHDVAAIAFSPVDSRKIFLGLVREEIQ
jgi:hypothetical protein